MTNAPLLPSPLLRQALLADAVTTAACAALMIAGAGFLEGLLGLPATLLRAAGLLLIPFVAYVVMLGFRERVSRGAVWSVIGLNAVWVVDSVLLLVSGYVTPTGSGIAFVLAQAAVVAMYAELQFMGLRRSSPALA
jgi:hypothetical protein